MLKGKDAGTIQIVNTGRMGIGGPFGADGSVHFSFGWLTGERKFQQSLEASDILNTDLSAMSNETGGFTNTNSNSYYGSLNAGEGLGLSVNVSHSAVRRDNQVCRYITVGGGSGLMGNATGVSVSGGSQVSKAKKVSFW